uniref:NADH dehydrogenase subunit 3 n=1 Tax=Amusiotheres obtusidentatus TaxID=2921221 RepID=UPI002027B84D|nr:NADH dehydrogenase subunit 3 [Amusiotheres obtusidentatus]UPL64966.1 NADH dehydrogenase subunit 3 [Amusiotheres obtusidentatus]
MFTMFIITFTSFIISLMVMMISSMLAKKTILDREKNSPYECGFDPKGSARLPFSLRFFLIAVIFLIFDVEITLLLPIAPTFNISEMHTWLLTSIFFLIILLMGLYYEWKMGALNWSN